MIYMHIYFWRYIYIYTCILVATKIKSEDIFSETEAHVMLYLVQLFYSLLRSTRMRTNTCMISLALFVCPAYLVRAEY